MESDFTLFSKQKNVLSLGKVTKMTLRLIFLVLLNTDEGKTCENAFNSFLFFYFEEGNPRSVSTKNFRRIYKKKKLSFAKHVLKNVISFCLKNTVDTP